MIGHVALLSNTGWALAQHRQEQIRDLVALGLRVSAIADYATGFDDEVRALGAEPHHVHCEALGKSVPRNLAAVARLARTLRRLCPDLLHCFGLKSIMHGGMAARMVGVPAIVDTLVGQGVFLGDQRRSLLKSAVQRVLRGVLNGHPVIFQNPDDLTAFVNDGLVPAHMAFHIPGCGVDVANFGEPPERPHPTVFIHASRMLWSKGIGRLEYAAQMVKVMRPEAEFHAFGGTQDDYGSDNPDFVTRAWLEGMDREGTVRWHGRVPFDEVKSWLLSPRTAALVYLSSYPEGVPRIAIEAAAAGLPIITTNTPGCRDVVEHGQSGWLCDGASLISLARQPTTVMLDSRAKQVARVLPDSLSEQAAIVMLDLLDNPAKARAWGARSREIAMRFDKSIVTRDTLRVYEHALYGATE